MKSLTPYQKRDQLPAKPQLKIKPFSTGLISQALQTISAALMPLPVQPDKKTELQRVKKDIAISESWGVFGKGLQQINKEKAIKNKEKQLQKKEQQRLYDEQMAAENYGASEPEYIPAETNTNAVKEPNQCSNCGGCHHCHIQINIWAR